MIQCNNMNVKLNNPLPMQMRLSVGETWRVCRYTCRHQAVVVCYVGPEVHRGEPPPPTAALTILATVTHMSSHFCIVLPHPRRCCDNERPSWCVLGHYPREWSSSVYKITAGVLDHGTPTCACTNCRRKHQCSVRCTTRTSCGSTACLLITLGRAGHRISS